ncbi:MAG: hypothetical protein QM711_10940 [Micropruina sp.]|uniref:hypothetical protein n=1 Tax=Micropruina sp. TaxID=2737536 RepID=UPI0039E40A3A
MNSSEAFASLRDGRFYQGIKGAIRNAVAADDTDHGVATDDGNPRILRRLIAAGFDGPGA